MDGSHWADLAQALTLGSRALRRRIADVTLRHKLTDTEFLFLCYCQREPTPVVQSQIAVSLGLSPAQVSGITEKLRTAGLIAVERGVQDRRKQFCLLSEKGAQLERLLAEELRQSLPRGGFQMKRLDLERLLELLDHLGRADVESSDAKSSKEAA
ncbi:MAG TPA: MarR family transcriptional regulator [Planctomycetes bacterium]|nr:MarR family transcriptional regulator [Planctomycetaceae bacterium]HIM30098.1 MarR family transcriptional regulator [Planctomycetota bacterium]